MEDLNYPESLHTSLDRRTCFPFSVAQVLEIHKAGLTLDLLFVLEKIELVDAFLEETTKFDPYIKTLQRKAYLSQDLKVTEAGKVVLQTIREKGSLVVAKKVRKEKVITDFDRFWSAYPTSDAFPEAGFSATRSLKVDKDKCFKKIKEFETEGITIDDLILAIETEVAMRKQETLKTRENKLKYLTNTATWLNQRKFEGLLEIAKSRKNVLPKAKVNQSFNI